MSSRATDFPTFRRPPVVEVALAVSFDPVLRLTTADLGVLWEREFRPRAFKFTEDQAPVRVVPEEFGAAMAGLPSVQFQVTSSRPTPRMLFLTEEGDELGR